MYVSKHVYIYCLYLHAESETDPYPDDYHHVHLVNYVLNSGLDSPGKDGGLLCSELSGVAACRDPKAGWASQLCQVCGCQTLRRLSVSQPEWPELKSRKCQKGHIPQVKMCSALKRGAACRQVSQMWSFKSQRGSSYFCTCCFINMYVSQKRQEDIVSSLTKQKRCI